MKILLGNEYENLINEIKDLENMNKKLNEECQRLASLISNKTKDCKMGGWCKRCRYVAYDSSVIKSSLFNLYSKNNIDGKVMYCSKHFKDICSDYEPWTTTE